MIRKESLTFIWGTVSVDELSDGSSWKTLATTVCIYVLLKLLQGGGAGTDPQHRVEKEVSIEALSQRSAVSPLPRFLRLRQQLALLPVDPRAAVHQPRGPGAPLLPPALPLSALASGPQNRRCATEHRPRHLLHQQPSQVRGEGGQRRLGIRTTLFVYLSFNGLIILA